MTVKLNVPYVSQWDPTAHLSRGDCGIVAACMIALWLGIKATPDEMLQKAWLPIGRYIYDFPDVIKAAQAVGVTLSYQYPATWKEIKLELDAHRPVITLLRYGVISGNQDDFDGSHFWTVIGYDDTGVFVNDPDWWLPRRDEGANRHIPMAEFTKAIGTPLLQTGNKPYQSLFVVLRDVDGV
ncbi:MAG TPA: C39 family peptidase [Phototrophicaceae bacterium]|nr:C39 family peptidase [Phototrophicaceae bacterium]